MKAQGVLVCMGLLAMAAPTMGREGCGERPEMDRGHGFFARQPVTFRLGEKVTDGWNLTDRSTVQNLVLVAPRRQSRPPALIFPDQKPVVLQPCEILWAQTVSIPKPGYDAFHIAFSDWQRVQAFVEMYGKGRLRITWRKEKGEMYFAERQ